MNPKFNIAAIKCLEAAKLIQTVKEPALKKTVDYTTGVLTDVAGMLLTKDIPVADSKK